MTRWETIAGLKYYRLPVAYRHETTTTISLNSAGSASLAIFSAIYPSLGRFAKWRSRSCSTPSHPTDEAWLTKPLICLREPRLPRDLHKQTAESTGHTAQGLSSPTVYLLVHLPTSLPFQPHLPLQRWSLSS